MNHMHNYRRKPLQNKLQIPKMVQQATKNPIFPSVTVGHTNYEKQPWVTQFEKLRLFIHCFILITKIQCQKHTNNN